MPRVSIIVPVYKVEPYLHRCVDSVLAQTCGDFDLILVDDGSPDKCGEICDAYAAGDSRVHALHRINGGLSAARNTGLEWVLEHSNSEWITFLDSDDWVHPRYLELLLQAVAETGLNLAVGGFRRTAEDGDLPELPDAISAQVVGTESFYCADKVTATVAWGKLYRKADFAQIRYPDGKIHEDELTTHKLLFRYPEIALVKQPLYQYYQNQQGIMRSSWSPKHIAEVAGMQEQMQFFHSHGFSKAEACAARAHLISIYRNLEQAEKCDHYAAQAKQLLKQLKSGLRKYGKLAGVSIHKEPWLFYKAFPIWTIPHRFIEKLRRNQK